MAINRKLSRERPKNATLEVDERFQSVRIIAVYETDQILHLRKRCVRARVCHIVREHAVRRLALERS
jgi:hypothetical protein